MLIIFIFIPIMYKTQSILALKMTKNLAIIVLGNKTVSISIIYHLTRYNKLLFELPIQLNEAIYQIIQLRIDY